MVYFVILAFGLIVLLKRAPRSILQLHFRWPYLIIASLLGEIILNMLHFSFAHWILPLFLLVIIVWLLVNFKLKGIPFILMGALLNAVTIVIYHGTMPVLIATMHLLHMSSSGTIGSRHTLSTYNGFWWLGDWIPVPPFIMSPGDIVVGLGLIRFALANTRKRATYVEPNTSK